MIRLDTILCPTDFSEDSRYALEVACGLARDQAARVILLHVVPRPAPIGRDAGIPAFKGAHTDEDLQAYREEMQTRLDALRGKAPYVQVETMLKDGDAAATIARAAQDTGSNLIVMGSHGACRYEAVMGSVAADVTATVNVPILSVRLPAGARARFAEPEAAVVG